MTVKLRLRRMGKKKQPTYRVVAADVRSPRDGRFIEIVGTYDPRTEPSQVRIDNDKAVAWLSKGARPTDRVRKLLEISGAWQQFTGARPASPDTGSGTAPEATKATKASKASKATKATKATEATEAGEASKTSRVADEATENETLPENDTSSTEATAREDANVDAGETASDEAEAGAPESAGEAAE